MFDIKEQLKKLPEKPGVYLMKDGSGNIIYVGKSKLLKNRVSSYFRSFNSHPPKVQTMVVNIKEFEYIITSSEMEALILEQTLIKKYKPRFNILLRDDKQYPYIKVTHTEDFPRVFMTRKVIRDKALYFGPYTNVDAVKKTLDIIHSVYPIRKCSKSIIDRKTHERPCLNFHIKKCLGPCNGLVHKEAYRAYIDEIIRILDGRTEQLLKTIQDRMMEEAAQMNYEKAAMYRDYQQAVIAINEKQKVVQTEDVNQDVIAMDIQGDKACVMIFYIRGGKIIGRDQQVFDGIEGMESAEILYDYMTQYYAGSEMIPKDILIDRMVDSKELVEEWLTQKSRHKINITVPLKGEKKKLVELVAENAKEYLDKFSVKIERDLLIQKELNQLLKAILDSDKDIYRLEAYDISNIYGVYAVGTMIVYEQYRKKPTDYRKFKIKQVVGPDDYASMREMLTRRFERGLEERREIDAKGMREGDKFAIFPDVCLIDGGKGHVGVIEEVLETLGLDIPVVGMVKNDKHKTEKLYYKGRFIEIKGNELIYKFIYEIQEEVHRFSIEYHRNVRSKSMTGSLLDEIEGIGPNRKKQLMIHFQSIERMKEATLEELLSVPGMNRALAERLRAFLQAMGD